MPLSHMHVTFSASVVLIQKLGQDLPHHRMLLSKYGASRAGIKSAFVADMQVACALPSSPQRLLVSGLNDAVAVWRHFYTLLSLCCAVPEKRPFCPAVGPSVLGERATLGFLRGRWRCPYQRPDPANFPIRVIGNRHRLLALRQNQLSLGPFLPQCAPVPSPQFGRSSISPLG